MPAQTIPHHARPLRIIASSLLAITLATPALAQDDTEADLGPGVSVTVYNQNFAVVKERRTMDLPAGRGTVRFEDVAATIVPETVQFSSLRPEDSARVIEQNYEFDLVSADVLLTKYLDKPIGIVDRDGGLLEGTLLASAADQLVLATDGRVELIPRGENIKDIRFSSLPEGLLVRPTLVWQVESQEAGEHLVKVAYRANKMSWNVNYRAVAAADEETIDLSGWVTITNQTGTTFENAGIKLMAGDVHVVEEAYYGLQMERPALAEGRPAGFEEKAFAEYHLYTLGRTTTLADAQTKQIELLEVTGVPVTRSYRYQAGYGTRVGTILEFDNSAELREGLGVPLPKGPVRVFQIDADDQPQFIGQDEIDHTPKNEPVRLRVGYAFDLAAERTMTDQRRGPGRRDNEQDWQIRLRNHKNQPVTITVRETLAGNQNWQILRSSHEFERKDFRTIETNVDVPANSETTVTYTVRYTQ